MIVVDSSGWLEYAGEGNNASLFAPLVENTSELIVPSICITEVFKRLARQRDEATAFKVLSAMQLGRIVDLDLNIALMAARIGLETGLPLADSIILATARTNRATLWTQDADFKGIPGVKYVRHH